MDVKALLIISLVCSVTFTRGKRTESSHKPNCLAANLTGLGLLSTNIALWRGCKIISRFLDSSFDLSSVRIDKAWNWEQSFGAIFAVTLIAPLPPLLLNSYALSSLPVNCKKSLPIFFNVWSTLFKSPVASFTPIIFFNSYNLAIVSTDISITDLPGIL